MRAAQVVRQLEQGPCGKRESSVYKGPEKA